MSSGNQITDWKLLQRTGQPCQQAAVTSQVDSGLKRCLILLKEQLVPCTLWGDTMKISSFWLIFLGLRRNHDPSVMTSFLPWPNKNVLDYATTFFG